MRKKNVDFEWLFCYEKKANEIKNSNEKKMNRGMNEELKK